MFLSLVWNHTNGHSLGHKKVNFLATLARDVCRGRKDPSENLHSIGIYFPTNYLSIWELSSQMRLCTVEVHRTFETEPYQFSFCSYSRCQWSRVPVRNFWRKKPLRAALKTGWLCVLLLGVFRISHKHVPAIIQMWKNNASTFSGYLPTLLSPQFIHTQSQPQVYLKALPSNHYKTHTDTLLSRWSSTLPEPARPQQTEATLPQLVRIVTRLDCNASWVHVWHN